MSSVSANSLSSLVIGELPKSAYGIQPIEQSVPPKDLRSKLRQKAQTRYGRIVTKSPRRPGSSIAAPKPQSFLLRNVASATSGSLVYTLLQAVSLIVITHLGGAEDTGLFLLAQGIATPAALLTGLRLRDQIATSPGNGLSMPYTRRQTRLTVPTFVVGSALWLIFAGTESGAIGAMVLLANLSQGHVWTVQGGLLRQERFLSASALDAILGLLSVLSIGVGYWLEGLALAAFLLASTWTAFSVICVRQLATGDWRTELANPLVADLRMGFSSMGSVGQISAGRIGTAAFLGQSALARLGTGSFLIRTSQPLVRGLLKVNAPRLANARRDGVLETHSVEQRLIQFGLLGALLTTPLFALLGYWFGAPSIQIAFADDVVASAATYSVLLGAAPILYLSMLLSQLLVARQESGAVMWVSAVAVICTAATIYPLATLWDEPGAAASIGLGYLVRCITAIVMLRRSEPALDQPN